jgi:glucokinase
VGPVPYTREDGSSGGDAVPIVLAVDIGGTKTAVAAVNARGEIGHRWRWPTDGTPGPWVDRLMAIVSEFDSHPGAPRAIGVAVPSVLDGPRERVVWAPNLPGWTNVPLASMLRQKAALPVAMDLDGHLAAVGEHWLGALKGIDDCVCVVVGTGIGGGVLVHGRLLRGRQNLSGCLGWMVVGDSDRAPERAGAVGWLESQAGGSALQEFAAALGHSRSPRPVEELVAASVAGEREATAVLTRVGQLIGRAVANVVNVLSPDAVALGGTVITGAPIVLSEARKAVDFYLQPYLRTGLAVVEAVTGPDAPLLGAARMAIDVSEGG